MTESTRESPVWTETNDCGSTPDEIFDSFVSTPADFHAVLRALVRTADAKGVDVRGSWSVDSEAIEAGSWDVEIVELVRKN